MISRVDFVGIPSQDAERSRSLPPALFTDPDGNDLMLHHRYSAYAQGAEGGLATSSRPAVPPRLAGAAQRSRRTAS